MPLQTLNKRYYRAVTAILMWMKYISMIVAIIDFINNT